MSYNVKCYKILPKNCIRWLILGTSKEYLVTRHSCTCVDFLLKVTKKEHKHCKHIDILINALNNNEFDTYSINSIEFRELRPYLLEFKK